MLNLEMWERTILQRLEKQAFTDGSHDLDHFKRVAFRALWLNDQENLGGDPLVILVAGLLHDLVNVPKNSKDRSRASRFSADAAIELLTSLNFPSHLLPNIHHAIAAHSFTARIRPRTIEAKCVQDADRVDTLGALGIARTFYASGIMGTQLVNWNDPLGAGREYDDNKWALDHFEVKLFLLINQMNTRYGKEMSKTRCDFMRKFRSSLIKGGRYSIEYQFVVELAQLGKASQPLHVNLLETAKNPSMRYFVEQLEREAQVPLLVEHIS